MDKESIQLLQDIDCNCNDCFYMVRDIEAYKKIVEQDKANQIWFFRRRKVRRIIRARKHKDPEKRKQAIKEAVAMTYTYIPQNVPLHYGYCRKFVKKVTFIPNTMQLHTQNCFTHRKDITA